MAHLYFKIKRRETRVCYLRVHTNTSCVGVDTTLQAAAPDCELTDDKDDVLPSKNVNVAVVEL